MPTKIEWCDETWSPITGCTQVSEGCRKCYAKRMAERLAGRCGYPKDDPFKVTFHPDQIEKPLKWRKPRRIFVCSMGDLFHDDVRHEWVRDVFHIIDCCRDHVFILLTKRPRNMQRFVENERIKIDEDYRHVWLGVTAEDQKTADERIPILLSIPAAVRFVSVEPCLSQIDLTPWLNSDMVSKNHKGVFYYERKREGIFGTSGNRVVQGGLKGRNDMEDGTICGRQPDREQAIYEDDGGADKGGKVFVKRPHENFVHRGDKEEDGNLCPSNYMDDVEQCGHPGGTGDQPYRREPRKQQSQKLGNSHEAGKHITCRPRVESLRQGCAAGGSEYEREINGWTSQNYKEVVQGKADTSIENSQYVRREPGNSKRHSCKEKLDTHFGLDWVIAGGETGPGARPMQIQWVRDLRDQCAAATVPFFFKKWGPKADEISDGVIDGKVWREFPDMTR